MKYALTVAAIVVLGAGTLHAQTGTFQDTLAAGQTKNWSDVTAWTQLGGTDVDGIPDVDDEVTLNNVAWPSGWKLNMDAGWSANILTVNAAGGNDHRLEMLVDGTINVLNFNRTTANAYSHFFIMANATTLTLTELNETGTRPWRAVFGGSGDQTMKFVGDAKIRYIGNGGIDGMEVTSLGRSNDFSEATSVWLGQYDTGKTLVTETLDDRGTQNYVNALIIGRTDNNDQEWTVQAGAHPQLSLHVGSGRQSIAKVGTGDVFMQDVDVRFDTSFIDGAISGNGSGWFLGNDYSGTVSMNSFEVVSTAASYRRFGIGGHLLLDGESGLQVGGTGTGRAFSAITGDADLEIYIRTGQWAVGNIGPLQVADGGGSIYLGSTGTGGVEFNISQADRDNDRRSEVCVKAQTFHIASANSFITDETRGIADTSKWGGQVEFSGSFINQSTRRADWETEHSTIRYVGPADTRATFELASLDNGTAGPGVDNFVIDKLVIGKTADGTESESWLWLTDTFDNYTGDGTPEVLYVNTLEIYGGSWLLLRGLTLYYQDGGDWVQASLGAFMDGTIWVPEPASAMLLAMTLLPLLRRRTRTRG